MRQTLPSRGKSANTKRRSPPGLHWPAVSSGHPLPQLVQGWPPGFSAVRRVADVPSPQHFPRSGRPPSVGTGEDVLDVIVDQHNVKVAALVSIVLGQFRIDFPPNPVGRLLLPQEDE